MSINIIFQIQQRKNSLAKCLQRRRVTGTLLKNTKTDRKTKRQSLSNQLKKTSLLSCLTFTAIKHEWCPFFEPWIVLGFVYLYKGICCVHVIQCMSFLWYRESRKAQAMIHNGFEFLLILLNCNDYALYLVINDEICKCTFW